MRVASETVLPVPMERAWDLLLRWEDQPRWMRDADSVRVVGAQREGVGTTVAVRTRVLNVPLFTERLEVTIWEPPRRLVMAHRSFVRGVGTWRLQPVEGGTWFTWVEELRLPLTGHRRAGAACLPPVHAAADGGGPRGAPRALRRRLSASVAPAALAWFGKRGSPVRPG